MKQAYILKAVRTPGCKATRGKFANCRPDYLATVALTGLLQKTGVDPMDIEDVILGCSFPEAEQGMNVGRMAALSSGLPYQVPGQTVNRFCSSGLQSIAMAAERIMAGFADCIVAGGVESMTCVPMGGNKYSANPELVENRPESYASMGITAEKVAERYDVSREDQDRFGLQSNERALAAIARGKFTEEIIPVPVERTGLEGDKRVAATEVVDIDDGPRKTTLEKMARLKSPFKAGGSVTAGNSSQMTDGAAVTLVVSEEYLKKVSQDPMARFVAFDVKGCPPEIMGIGPSLAIPGVLEKAGMKFEAIDLYEINEAFASQALYCLRELGLSQEKVNVNGGAIALGHPLGCTGAKLTTTLLHEMQRRDAKRGIVSMCIGGGMGAAGIFERV
ncbi:MAG: thiolase family protein [Desulfohalobiaceae bacterium]|nr:thiolase family protein [Desulfohalobiaceae bacterium]